MSKNIIEVAKRNLSVQTDGPAEQANQSVIVRYGDTIVMTNTTMGSPREGIDFFPLSVDYEEKFYAAGKIRGSRFMRREGRPSDVSILTSRIIDRCLRPLFNKGIKNEVQIVATCLSWDTENDPDIIGINSASIALALSDIPWNGPLAAVRVAKVKDQFIVNPTHSEREEEDMEILFCALMSDEKELLINMIEAEGDQATEQDIMLAWKTAEKPLTDLCNFFQELANKEGKEKIVIDMPDINLELKKEVETTLSSEIDKMIYTVDRKERQEIKNNISEKIQENWPEDVKEVWQLIDEITSDIVKENILKNNKRPDGRRIDEIRPLSMDVAVLPRAHGSAIFSRGETKSLSIVTLGAPGDQLLMDGMILNGKKNFMHHYNFPAYSVGEVRPMRGPGRREIGHGMLGEKAIFPLLPEQKDFPYTIRAVSEILSSNGSTSQAALSATGLALMDAGVPLKNHIAGISIGIIQQGKEYKMITDIQGMEDHHGGMDFKVAGTKQGITAIQLDVKIKGINGQMLEETLERAKLARLQILEKIVVTIPASRPNLSPYAPRIITLQINPEKIREVIGPGGKVINEIIDTTGANIDIEDSGLIFVTSENEESAEKAVKWIKEITREVEVGEVFEGEVKRITTFGAFVEVLPGQDGLVHISKMSSKRVEKVEDILSLGDKIKVKVIGIDNQGRIDLSMKDVDKE
jgi:polyribonucleotide nucleotidyltransferase